MILYEGKMTCFPLSLSRPNSVKTEEAEEHGRDTSSATSLFHSVINPSPQNECVMRFSFSD